MEWKSRSVEIERQACTSRLSCFLFRSSRTGTFEIQLHNFLLAIAAPSRRARSLAQAICGWTRPAQAAVGAGDDVFLADDFSERDDAIGYQFRVLDEVG